MYLRDVTWRRRNVPYRKKERYNIPEKCGKMLKFDEEKSIVVTEV